MGCRYIFRFIADELDSYQTGTIHRQHFTVRDVPGVKQTDVNGRPVTSESLFLQPFWCDTVLS